MISLADRFAALLQAKPIMGRPTIGPRPLSQAERTSRHEAKDKAQRIEDIAILDMETDPFDNTRSDAIEPFLAVLYADNFDPIIIWDSDLDSFIIRVVCAIENLPRRYTVYAHNGGKFDYLFLIHKIRGEVKFKGRGLMTATIGTHKLRDSFHLIPEKLANYKKDAFDYSKLLRCNRDQYREEIIDYCLHDCKYLLQLIQHFIRENGFKLTIGQAAISKLKKLYPFKTIGGHTDAFLRHYYFGGRVECLAGRGKFLPTRDGLQLEPRWKLYDINSAYPEAMAYSQHPIGSSYDARRGEPGQHTIFVDVQAKNTGALLSIDPANGTLTSRIQRGRFRTTIWEYQTAIDLGLIEVERINWCIDCEERTDFRDFVLPMYEIKDRLKRRLDFIKESGFEGSPEWFEAKAEYICVKLYLNNAYGKFAQNPRRYKESYITDYGERPPYEKIQDAIDEWGAMPKVEVNGSYAIWQKPAILRYGSFANVGTAASITGAVRAKLMRAISFAQTPIYCDTDSLICEGLPGVEIHSSKLGAWDIEAEFSSVEILGKKLYHAVTCETGKKVVKSKGVAGLTSDDFRILLDGKTVTNRAKAITISASQQQTYIERTIRATAPVFGA